MRKTESMRPISSKTEKTFSDFILAEYLTIPKTIIIFGAFGFLISTLQFDISIVAEALSVGAMMAAIYYTYIIARAKAPPYRQAGAALMLVATSAYVLPVSIFSNWSISIMTDIAIMYILIVGCACNYKDKS